MGIGGPTVEDLSESFVIITEYNRSVQGFLVSKIDRIINTSWADILPPPSASGSNSYMTAITKLDGELIEIIDVEKVLAEVVGADESVSSELKDQLSTQNSEAQPHILVADDSSVARQQIKRTMDQIGIDTTIVRDGKEALDQLKAWADEGIDVRNYISLVISDIEMPEMDGFEATKIIREKEKETGRHIPIVALTAHAFLEDKKMCLEAGMDAYTTKPIKIKALFRIIEGIFREVKVTS